MTSRGIREVDATTSDLLKELVALLRQNRTQLREEWAQRITEARLLTAMSKDEMFAEATSVYDNYVEALSTGTFEALQAYARNLPERIIPRERQVLQLVGEGKSTKEVAEVLGISAKTVESHRAKLMHKLDIHDVAELVRYAIRRGLVEA